MKPDGCPHSDCARCNGTVAKLEAQVAAWNHAAMVVVDSKRGMGHRVPASVGLAIDALDALRDKG